MQLTAESLKEVNARESQNPESTSSFESVISCATKTKTKIKKFAKLLNYARYFRERSGQVLKRPVLLDSPTGTQQPQDTDTEYKATKGLLPKVKTRRSSWDRLNQGASL